MSRLVVSKRVNPPKAQLRGADVSYNMTLTVGVGMHCEPPN